MPENHQSTRRNFFLFTVVLALAVGGVAYWWIALRSDSNSIRIVTWNLQWFPGSKPHSSAEEERQQMDAAAKALAKLDADIYCFQEVKTSEAAKELVGRLKGQNLHRVSVFESDYIPDDPNEEVVLQQLVIASRYPALSTAAEQFGEENGVDPPRGFAFAALDAGDGQLILVWTVHLKANSRDAEGNIAKREGAARQLVRHIEDTIDTYTKQGWKNPITVVVGDLNTDTMDARFKDEQTFEILQQAGLTSDWLNLPVTKRVTLPASGRWPDAGFDWAFFGPSERVKGKSSVGKVDDGISDHRPVVLELKR